MVNPKMPFMHHSSSPQMTIVILRSKTHRHDQISTTYFYTTANLMYCGQLKSKNSLLKKQPLLTVSYSKVYLRCKRLNVYMIPNKILEISVFSIYWYFFCYVTVKIINVFTVINLKLDTSSNLSWYSQGQSHNKDNLN